MKNKLLAAWTYFRRGHQVYLVFCMAMLNFVTIQHKLLIQNVPWLAEVFPSQWIFGLFCMAAYVPLSTWLGYWDYKKLSVPKDMELSAKANPYSKDLMLALTLLASGENEKAKSVMQKWL